MLYSFQLAWRRIKRSWMKSLLSAIQLGIALTLFITVLTIYTGVESKIYHYKRSFGADMYTITVFEKAAVGEHMPFQFRDELIEELISTGKWKIYKGTLHADENGTLIASISEELFRMITNDGVVNSDLFARLGFRQSRADIRIVPVSAVSTDESYSKVWIEGEMDTKARRMLLENLAKYGSNYHFSIENVLELSKEELNTARGLSLVFLVFTISIIVCFTIGHFGMVSLEYLRNKRDWAILLMLGSSRNHIISSYMLQFLIIALPVFVFALLFSSAIIYVYDPIYLEHLSLTSLTTLFILLCIMLLSSLPITKLKNDHLISHLS